MARVSKVAADSAVFDSFLMLNVYAHRDPNPRNLPKTHEPALHVENLRQIAAAIGGRSLTIWAAWGSLIATRLYLRPLLKDILALPELAPSKWVSRGQISKHGHPHHPARVKEPSVLVPYGVDHYR